MLSYERLWPEARGELQKSIYLNLDAVVSRAEKAWGEGLNLLPLRISLENHTDSPKARWRSLADREALVQSSWNDAVERVTALGWRLHTWAVGEQSRCFIPAPLFEWPAG